MRRLVIPVLTTVLIVLAMVYQARTVEPVLCEAPSVSLGEIEGFVSEPIAVSEKEIDLLPKDTRFDKRLYTATDGSWFQVSMVFGGHSKSSIHRPELCLPAQGYQMSDPHDLNVAGVDWHCVRMTHRDAPPLGFAYTFFNQEGFRTSSHVRRIFQDVIDRSLRNRVDRWVMVTVNASTADDVRLSRFLACLKGVVK